MEKQPIRILHVIGSMKLGGAENLIMNLYRNIDRSRVQFDFVENTLQKAAFDDEIFALGGRIFNCPHYNGKNHLTYTKWWRAFFDAHAGEFAAVHGHIGSTAAIYLRIAKKHGLFTIAHSHNTRGVGFKDVLYRTLAFPTRYIADQFFACSRQAGIDRYGKKVGANPARCIVLHNAIDTNHFAYNTFVRTITRTKLGISEQELVIGHVGRFVQQKNHTFLLDIFNELLKMNPNSRLLLLGEGDTEEQVQQKAKTLGIAQKVIFAGTHSDTAPFYQAMDVFVLPSLFEGFGIVNIEAQCSGLPCLISDKVAKDSVLAENLVSVRSLNDHAKKWAEDICLCLRTPRTDHAAVIAEKGFDILQTVNWLSDYYCSLQRVK